MARRRPQARSVRLAELQRGRGHLDAADAEPSPARGIAALWARPATPTDGLRIAYSYLVAVLGTLLASSIGWAIAARLYDSGAVCRGDDSLACPVVAMALWIVPLCGVLLGLGAWWLRLGWLWWLVGVALSCVLVELIGDPTSPWLLALLLVPLAVALITDPGRDGLGRRRRLVFAVVAVLAIAQFVAVAATAILR